MKAFRGSTLIFCVLAVAVSTARPALAADAVSRQPDGHPNLDGIWQVLSPAVWNLEDHAASAGVPAGYGVVVGGTIPYKASALAQREQNRQHPQNDPEAKCFMAGVPRSTYMPYPFQIVQNATKVIMLYEYVHSMRIVRVDGSAHPPADIDLWMGDSRGHWDGDTLVVDVDSQSADTWLDRSGNYHSGAMHVVERYTPAGPDHIRYQATIEDPDVFSRPWQINLVLYRRVEPGLQVLEYECNAYQMLGKPAQPAPAARASSSAP